MTTPDFTAQAKRFVERSTLYDNVVDRFDTELVEGGAVVEDTWGDVKLQDSPHDIHEAHHTADHGNAAWCRAVAAELLRRAEELETPPSNAHFENCADNCGDDR